MGKKVGTCLLIDDDPDDQYIFLHALQRVHPSIVCEVANDGRLALEMMRNPKSILPSIIFLDINMPRMNGIDCLRLLKSESAIRHIPVYIYTTYLQRGVAELCQSLGAEECMAKFSKLEDLLVYLKKVLSSYTSIIV
jgi:CheY-like chemotaxis protein